METKAHADKMMDLLLQCRQCLKPATLQAAGHCETTQSRASPALFGVVTEDHVLHCEAALSQPTYRLTSMHLPTSFPETIRMDDWLVVVKSLVSNVAQLLGRWSLAVRLSLTCN